jgi:hypothetical protein
MGDHQKWPRHKRIVQRAKSAPQALVSATASAENVRLYPMIKYESVLFCILHCLQASSFSIEPHTPAILSVSTLYYKDDSSNLRRCSEQTRYERAGLIADSNHRTIFYFMPRVIR